MSTTANTGAQLVRRALFKCGVERVLAIVDTLNLQPTTGADIVVVAPIRNLKKSRSLDVFATHAPWAAVRSLAEMLTQEALARVVELLGDSADNPTEGELRQSVAQLLDEETPKEVVGLMLALAVANEVPAAPHCRKLLEDDPRFELPALESTAPPSGLLNPKAVDPAVREQRRRRREEQKTVRSRHKTHPPSRTDVRAGGRPEETPVRSSPSLANQGAALHPDVEVISRRRLVLTPLEGATYSVDHPLSGWVIELNVEYDSGHVDADGATSKRRPVVVLAGSDTSLLVRPVYSQPSAERTLLVGWNRVGLARPSYVDRFHLEVPLNAAATTARFGRLSDDEWNALF